MLLAAGVQGSLSSPLDAAYWLWAAGEYVQAARERSLATELRPALDAALAHIERDWAAPCAHWLDATRSGVFTSHLAVYYAGVQAYDRICGGEAALRLLKAIRELVFASLIKDGRLVGMVGDTAIYADVVAAAIPFGMLGIEDRILVEALYKVEEQLAGKGVRLTANDTYFGGCERSDVTCLLAWYYANKGELGRAKSLLAHIDALCARDGALHEADAATAREPLYADYWRRELGGAPGVSLLAELLYGLAWDSVRAAAVVSAVGARRAEEAAGEGGAALTAGAKGAAAVKLLHRPTGYDDPYVTMPNERFPRHPEAGEAIVVRLMTEPFQPGHRPDVIVSVNGIVQNEQVRMAEDKTAECESRWVARLGAFAGGDRVEYTFRVHAGEAEVRSETYRFDVREWRQLRRVQALQAVDGGIAVAFEPVAGCYPVVTFTVTEGGPLRIAYRHDTAAADAAVPPRGLPLPASAAGYPRELTLPVGDAALLVAVTADGELRIELGDRSSDGLGAASRMASYTDAGKQLFEVLTDAAGAVHKLRMNVRSGARDRWFGMGERYAEYEYSGHDVDQYVYNQYRDQGLKTYMPVPFAISSGRYGVYVDSPLYSVFRFRTELSDLVAVEADVSPQTQRLELILLAGEPLRLTEQFSSIVGKPELPPKWSFGPWMSSNNWDSQAEVLKQLELTERYEIPATVLVIEQWSDEATFYIFNDAQYEAKDGDEAFAYGDFRFPEWGRWPDPKRMMEQLHAGGLKVLLWQIPIHKFLYGAVHEQRDRDEAALLEGGYAVSNGDGTPYTLPYNWFKDCHIVDFTNPRACDWWFAKRRYLVEEVGVDGFKTDGGEFVFGHDLQFHDGSTGREMRNLYPNLYVGSYYRFVQQHAPDGGITFSRAGYTGAQRYPLHWAGDERSTFAAFRSSVIAGLTSGMAGIPFWGWDLAGFHGDIPTSELFVRSAQMAAFCPVMQYHAETKGEFNQDRTPWNIAERTGDMDAIHLYKKYADLRMNLLPYIYREAIESSRSGKPMMRAMLLAFPDDPRCTEMIGQYMFGDSLLVAPVMEEGATTKTMYFPEGSWVSLFDSHELAGPAAVVVRAELPDVPVYIRQDRIVPLNLGQELRLCGHVGNRVDRYERLAFCLYVKTEARLRFGDDLGTELDLAASRNGGTLLMEWSGALEAAGGEIVIIVRGQDEATSVTEQYRPGEEELWSKVEEVTLSVEESRPNAESRQYVDEAPPNSEGWLPNGRPYAEAIGKDTLRPGTYCWDGADLLVCVSGAVGSGRLVVTGTDV
jgi:alpha-glucosidase (family GH31 glycosyl hydrolase)